MKTTLPYERTVLANGVRVIFVPMPLAKSVTVSIMVGTGSRYETDQNAGVSHFLEHLVFKGTKNRPTQREISLAIEGMGGIINAWTDCEMTAFWTKVLPSHFADSFDVLADIFLNPLFREKDVEGERGVILEEKKRSEDIPEERIFEVFLETLYGKQPLGRRIIGREEFLKKATNKDLISYRKKNYKAGGIAVVVAGNISQMGGEKKALESVDRYFNGLTKGERMPYARIKEDQRKPVFKLLQKKTEQAHLCLGFRIFNNSHPDHYKMAVLNSVLGRGMSSRFFEEIRRKRGLCYHISSSDDYFMDTGIWNVYAGLNTAKIEEAIKAILVEINKVKEEKVPQQELNFAKEKIKGPFLFSMESTNAVVDFYGRQELLYPEIETPEEVIAKIDKVTAGDVLDLARNYFTNERLNLSIIGPFKGESRFEKVLKI
jgi:predicted Zn-dependent peptidase